MEKSWKEKNKELAKFWKPHIEQWSESGVSQVEYCRQHDLIPHRFTYWKTKLKPKHLPVKFIQIPNSLPIHVPGLKLNIGSGLQIEIPDDFSCDTLEKILTTLRILK